MRHKFRRSAVVAVEARRVEAEAEDRGAVELVAARAEAAELMARCASETLGLR